MKVFTEEEEEICLDVNPFEGDFDDESISLSDKFVTARKARPCFFCKEQIEVGSRIRVITEIFDGIRSASMCNTCCNSIIEDEKELDDANYEFKDGYPDRFETRWQNACKKSN